MAKDAVVGVSIGTIIVLGVTAAVTAGLWGCPKYGVYTQRMTGEGELQRAQQNRQIRVNEAQAALDAAHLTAEAEIVKASGVAKANEIMAANLGGPEGYLRWKYIEMLQEQHGATTIYIPTEAQIPILEAGHAQLPHSSN